MSKTSWAEFERLERIIDEPLQISSSLQLNSELRHDRIDQANLLQSRWSVFGIILRTATRLM